MENKHFNSHAIASFVLALLGLFIIPIILEPLALWQSNEFFNDYAKNNSEQGYELAYTAKIISKIILWVFAAYLGIIILALIIGGIASL